MADNLTRRVNFADFIETTEDIGVKPGKLGKEFARIIQFPIDELVELLDLQRIKGTGTSTINYKTGSTRSINEITDAVISFFNALTALYNGFASQLRDLEQGQNVDRNIGYDLVAINKGELRAMAQSNATKEQIAGRFITEVQSEFPDLLQRMNAKAAMTFARGVEKYAESVQAAAGEAIEKADNATREKIAAEETAKTTEGVADAVTYWDAKYHSHKKANWFWFIAFVTVLVLGIVVVFFGESLLPGVPGGESGDAGYKWAHYLRVVIVPTLAVAWLLRLISRQFITHLLLQEDARLRQTLVRTFLGLQRNADAEIADKERAHMLEAIFRPLPVTPNGDVSQPSFADIAKVAK